VGLLEALGLRPDGDPAAMRAYATLLRAVAEDIHRAGEGAAAAVDGATFVGPAGDATRRRAGQLRARSRAAASNLRTLADDVARRAGDVERGQHAWDRLFERIEEQLREASGGGSR